MRKILLDEGYKKIIAYDPLAIENFKKEYNLPIEYARNISNIINKAEHLVILTAWKEFKNNRNLQNKNVLDFRYIL